MPSMSSIPRPYQRGLTELRHRLASEQLQRNLARIQQIHAASLRDGAVLVIQARPDKQENPALAGVAGLRTNR
jgi:hypothetical protein